MSKHNTPKVERLVTVPPSRPWQKHRCQATVNDQTARWRKRCGKDDRCEFGADWIVDGEELCTRHAGARLLTLMEEAR